MPIPISCPSCSARLSVPDTAAGKTVKCPKCRSAMTIPPADTGFDVVDEPAAPPRRAAPVAAARPNSPRDADEDDYEEDDRSRRKGKKKAKKPSGGLPVVVWVVIGVGFLAIAGGLAGVLLFWTSSRDTPANPGVAGGPDGPVILRGKAGPTGGSGLPEGWKTVNPPGTGLTVAVPGDLQEVAVGARSAKAAASRWNTTAGRMQYEVMVVTPDKEPPPGPPPDWYFDDLCDGLAQQVGLGRSDRRTRVSVNGHPGRQMVFADGEKNAIVRLIFAGRQVYFLWVTGPERLDEADRTVAPFFDSVQIQGGGTR